MTRQYILGSKLFDARGREKETGAMRSQGSRGRQPWATCRNPFDPRIGANRIGPALLVNRVLRFYRPRHLVAFRLFHRDLYRLLQLGIAARQHGVITVAQLLAAGLSRAAIRHRERTGRLHRLHRPG